MGNHHVAVRILKSQYERLERHAQRFGKSVERQVQEALTEYIECDLDLYEEHYGKKPVSIKRKAPTVVVLPCAV